MTDFTAATLARWRRTRFNYATGDDCLMSLADHVLSVTGCDYGAVWRNRYRTEVEAFAFVDAYGGSLAMIDMSGLARTDTPQRGDIVLATVHGHEIGGIFTGDSVAFRMPRGVVELNARLIRIIASWRVE